MPLPKTVVTDKPPGKVFDYLSDFTSTTDWDPGTVTTVRQHGPFLPAGTDPAREPGRSRPAPGAQPTGVTGAPSLVPEYRGGFGPRLRGSGDAWRI
jgi:hypothetical protein